MNKNWINALITKSTHFLGLFLEVLVLLLFLVSFPLSLSAQENTANSGNVSLGALYFILPWTTHDDGLRSDVIITNTEQRQAQIQISAYDRNGLPVFVDNIINILEPGETSIIDTKLLPPNIASLRVDTNNSIDGSVNFGTSDGNKSATVPAFKTGSKKLDFPSLLDGDFKYRSLTLFNPNDEYAGLAVSGFDKEGQEVTPAPFDLMPMAPKETRTITLSNIFDANLQNNVATVRLTSAKNIMGFQLVTELSVMLGVVAVELSDNNMPVSTKLSTSIVPIIDFPVDQSLYLPGSYKNRSFYYDHVHLGEDINLSFGHPIKAVADGKIVQYEFHIGYATSNDGTSIAAVIEHDLGRTITLNLIKGHIKTVSISKITSIGLSLRPVDKHEFAGFVVLYADNHSINRV